MAITVGDKTYRNLPEQVEENANNIEDIKARISELGTVMVYKGSVATYADLPTEGQKIGDFYNVLDTGDNYAWDGEGWDQVASSVDLSNLVDLDSSQTITGEKTFDNIHISFKENNKTNSIKFNGLYSTPEIYVDLYDLNVNVPIRVGGELYPQTSATFDIGTSGAKWKDLYLSGTTYTSTLEISPFDSSSTGNWQIKTYYNALRFYAPNGTSYLNVNTSAVWGYGNGNTDLGTSTTPWGNLYLRGTAYLSNNTVASVEIDFTNQYSTGTIKYSGYQFLFSGAITSGAINPNSNNTRDLGSSSAKWKDLYLSGVLSDGTNSVSIADLKALIDYAKAQGWIS